MSRYSNINVSTIAGVNSELQKISDAIDTLLDREGTVPNSMEADLDMDSNDILNAGTINGNEINADTIIISGTELGGGTAVDVSSNYAWTGLHTYTQDITVNGYTVYHEGNLTEQVIAVGYTESNDYTAIASDANGVRRMSSASAQTFTVPAGVFSTGQTLSVYQEGAGQITIAGGVGVTINSELGYNIQAQHGFATIICLEDDDEGTEIWALTGSLEA